MIASMLITFAILYLGIGIGTMLIVCISLMCENEALNLMGLLFYVFLWPVMLYWYYEHLMNKDKVES